MKTMKRGVEFDTYDLYNGLSRRSTIDLVNELTILENVYNAILAELEYRIPTLEEHKDKMKIKKRTNIDK